MFPSFIGWPEHENVGIEIHASFRIVLPASVVIMSRFPVRICLSIPALESQRLRTKFLFFKFSAIQPVIHNLENYFLRSGTMIEYSI